MTTYSQSTPKGVDHHKKIVKW